MFFFFFFFFFCLLLVWLFFFFVFFFSFFGFHEFICNGCVIPSRKCAKLRKNNHLSILWSSPCGMLPPGYMSSMCTKNQNHNQSPKTQINYHFYIIAYTYLLQMLTVLLLMMIILLMISLCLEYIWS
uniref:Uncharacterized protein n=1 Tax=Opuntia streptacantha TaxID=393608 RepID=A0A7C8YYM8_OPUST